MSEGFANISAVSLVWATAGRDKGSLFVAVRAGGGFVEIADGRGRKVEKPKRKNIKHISPAGCPVYTGELTNKKIRRLLNEYLTHASIQQTADL